VVSGRPIPVDSIGGTRFNLSVDLQAGLYVYGRSGRSTVVMGYKYLHISNANLSRLNPGVDFQVIFAGYSVFR